VEFVWTLDGPAPTAKALLSAGKMPQPVRMDYDHYTDSQVLPVAQSIAAAMG
jgi:DNA polymerase-2